MRSFPAGFGASVFPMLPGSSYRIMTLSDFFMNPPLTDKQVLECVGRGDTLQCVQVLVVPGWRHH